MTGSRITKLALAALLMTACAVDDETNVAKSEVTNRSVASDVTLAVVRLSPTHLVTFSETRDGYREVVEDMHADLDRESRNLAALERTNASFEEIHRYLLPGRTVPAALLDADARAAARTAEPNEEVGPIESALGDAGFRSPPENAAVAWNWDADALWFKQYFYTGGTDGFFYANGSWAHATKKRKTDWYKASGFNQSFESSAHFRVDRSRNCGFLGVDLCWDTKLDEWLGNRYVRTYAGEGPKYRKAWLDGYGPAPRVALAVRWTLPTYGSPSPPNACGGHTQFACPSYPRCNPGLVEYNGGCYGCGTVGQSCCKDWGDIPTNGGWQGLCAQGYCSYPSGYCQY